MSAPQQPASSTPPREQVVELVRAAEAIRAEALELQRAVRLQGEVVRADSNGEVQIRTSRGDVEIRLPAEQNTRPPQIGTRVEVDFPPPNTQSSTAPQTTQQQEQVLLRPAPPPDSPPQTRSTDTPVEITNAPPPRPAAQTQITPPLNPNAEPVLNAFPAPGSLIQLTPVAPSALAQLSTQTPLPSLLASLTTGSFTSQNAPQNLVQISVAESLQNTQILQTPLAAFNAPDEGAAQQTQNTIPPLFPPPSSTGVLNFTPQALTEPNIVNAPILAQPPAFRLPSLITPNVVETPLQAFNAQPSIITDIAPPPTITQAPLTAPNTVQSPAPSLLSTSLTPPPLTSVQQSAPALEPLTVRIAQISSPAVQITAPTDPPAIPPARDHPILQNQRAETITAIVQAQGTEQPPILSLFLPQGADGFALQNFALQFPTQDIPLGSQIQITPQITPQLTTAAQAAPIHPAAVLPLSSLLAPLPAWPIMNDIHQTLLQASPAAAQAMAATTPNPAAGPAQFGPAALFFIAAIRGGDIQSWLGDKATEIIRNAGRSGLLTRLGQDAGLLNRIGAEPVAQDWRAMNIPLMWQGDIQKIALHYKHDDSGHDEDSQDHGQKGTRFVFDLNLSAMGKVQLDGLFRPISADGPRLDVILRTQDHFSGAMQAEMRRIYMDAIKPSQIGGELSFQTADQSWVTIEAQQDPALGMDA